MNNWRLVSFYTSNYKEIAHKYLIPSLKNLNFNNYIIEIPNLMGWKKATDYKPIFLKDCLNKFKNDLLWIDCDATVNFYPFLFDTIPEEYDIGVHYLEPYLLFGHNNVPKHLASGTIYLRNNERIFTLIDKWINLTSTCQWEQKTLEMAIKNSSDIKVFNLPREYCYITTRPNGSLPNVPLDNAIISHFQSSREMRRR